uniref:ATP-dependent RNA helicase DDX60 n=1 Tax=Castor canadensis TaxID=51338 RepID=A0A8C0WR29_CASCN
VFYWQVPHCFYLLALQYFQCLIGLGLPHAVCETLSLLKQVWPEGSDIRRVLCVISCSLSLRINCLDLKKAEDFCRLDCLSVAFLLHLPLSQRARSRFITSHWIKDLQTFFKMKKWCEYFILSKINIFEFWNLNLTHLSDLSDESLLKNIAFYYENENRKGLNLDLGNGIMKDYEHLWDTVSKLVRKFDVGKPFPVRTTKLNFLSKNPSPIKDSSQKTMPNLGFIPMSSKLIDEFAGDILKDLPFLRSDDPIVTSIVKQKEFDELVHWHSHRPLSDDYDRTKPNFGENPKDPYVLKSIQKLHRFQRFYGNSLESVSTKLIVTQGVKPKKDFNESKNKKAHAQIITRENKKRLLAKEEQKEEQKWNALSFSIEEKMKENLDSGINDLEDFLKSCKSNSVKVQVEMAGLTACLKAWKEHCRSESETTKDLSVAVQMMKRIHCLMEKYPEFLQEAEWKLIAKCLKYLGFDELANSLCQTQDVDDIKEKKRNKYSVGIGPARFQLQYMGHYLIREERKDPDPRVQDFIPDTWQRELLDVVDNYESAVIVAPTSSGKTYASYYCMERVLKESDEGVVVYVAPTKALVNQVAATVQHRYTKNLPSGGALCGVFTREYRQDALNSQVLVTVPACLEILLLAPHRQNWVKRIRYVIFDEIHCLGGEIGAEIWEHLLVMIRCPFLALSATISNPEHLTEWLQSVKRYWKEVDSTIGKRMASKRNGGYGANFPKDYMQVKQSYKVRLVLYGERYNDLEKYICSINNNDIYFNHYHPCAALTTDHIERYGFPSDLSLSPRESIQLYDTMFQVWKTWPQAQELCPENFIHFKDKVVIKKLDARKYEESLKVELTNWIKNGNEEKAKMVLRYLRPHLGSYSGNMMDKFPLLVEKLRKIEKLPSLQKVFDRVKFERKGDLLKALAKRGIGYHHSSMSAKEKQLVEILFRKGFIRVVTATGTLALGINMPCKSVIFAQNSVYLDALNYRQMSGRAGRRGQDLLGNVYFFDIPVVKIEKLIKSKVPELRGQFPFSVSLILRLMLLAAKADDPEDGRAKVMSVLKHSLLSFKQPRIMEMLKLYFLFSVQFLVKEGYLDQECNPMGFAGLVSHLHYHEPSNLVFVSFLVRGLFHDLCQPTKKGSKHFSEDVMEKLVLVLANLFGRRHLPARFQEANFKFYQSKVFLDELPKDFLAALQEYNMQITKDFAAFLLIVSKLADMKQECQLPLSKIEFTGKECIDSPLVSHLMNCTEGRVAISPFVCLSGNFDSNLLHPKIPNHAILRTIGINHTQAPVLWPQSFDSQGRIMPLNAYALDFYKHGSLVGLTQDNRYVFSLSLSFPSSPSLFPSPISSKNVSLRELCGNEDDNVVLAFEQLSKNFLEKFKKV